MKDDNDFPFILQFIGAMTLFGIFVFMLVCTCKQIEHWHKSFNTTCEITVQKE